MYRIIGVSIVAVLLALLSRQKSFKNGFEWSFVLLTVFLAIRYDFGNDYMSYLESFERYQSSSIGLFEFDKFFLLRDKGELIWMSLNLFFRPFGFFSLIIFLTVFENYVIYRFIKKNVDREWYWLAVFIFTFNSSIMLVGASMLRQWLALCIFLCCIDFIQKKKPLPYFALMLLATQIHTSAWALLAVYFVQFIPSRISKSFLYYAIPLYLLWLYYAPSLYGNNLELILQAEEMEKYGTYLEGEKVSYSIIGIITRYLFPIICVSQINRIDDPRRVLFLIFSLYLLVLPLTEVTPMIGRIGMYFSFLFICVFPETLNSIKKSPLFLPVIALYLLLTLYVYFPFYRSATFGEHYQLYQTIFSQPWQ